MSVVSIAAKLVTGAELVQQVQKVNDAIWPQPPAELEKESQWFQCTVINATQFDIIFESVYFNCGRFWSPPNQVNNFRDMTFSVCNADNSEAKGAAGGFVFSIFLDDQHRFYVSVGLASLAAGNTQAGVVESQSPQDGYSVATREGNYIESKDTYEAVDMNGNKRHVKFHVVAAPGAEMRIEIEQIVLL